MELGRSKLDTPIPLQHTSARARKRGHRLRRRAQEHRPALPVWEVRRRDLDLGRAELDAATFRGGSSDGRCLQHGLGRSHGTTDSFRHRERGRAANLDLDRIELGAESLRALAWLRGPYRNFFWSATS